MAVHRSNREVRLGHGPAKELWFRRRRHSEGKSENRSAASFAELWRGGRRGLVRGGIAKYSRWATAGVRDTDLNGLDGCGDVALGRPRLDVRQSRPCDRLQARTIRSDVR